MSIESPAGQFALMARSLRVSHRRRRSTLDLESALLVPLSK